MIGIVLGVALAGVAEPLALAPVQPSTPANAASEWVALVDRQRWDESWAAAGTWFRSQMPQVRWAATIQSARQPLGAVVSRTLKSETRANALPGAPDGEYDIVQFDTSFAQKRQAIETVVLAREASGWKAAGYFIR